ncbi:MAG: OmpA family protein [Flavobacteriales bacterium]
MAFQGASLCASAQHDTTWDGCINVREIFLPFDPGRYDISDTTYRDIRFNDALYLNEDEFTFWYKLIASGDCQVEFQVMGTHESDIYDFMLYRFSKENFCQAVVNRLVLPVNDNNYAVVAPTSGDKELHSAYQQPFTIRSGDVYYIAVIHISGEDCGHILFLKACGRMLAISAVKKSCFILAQPAVAVMPPLKTELPLSDSLLVKTHVDIRGRALDNDNGQPIDATLTITDQQGGQELLIQVDDSAGYSMEFERGRSYRYTCSSLGYRTIEGSLSFETESGYDFYLNKVKAGESFVMDNIYFYPNTYAFRSGADKQLDELLRFLLAHPAVEIEIEGHTAGNNRVSQPANSRKGAAWAYTGSAKKLSRMRAEAVKKYLVAKGIDPIRLSTKGFGSERPVVSHPRTQDERLKNMRVEIRITSGEPSPPADYRKVVPLDK